MAHRKYVTELMARCLDSPVLDLLCDSIVEHLVARSLLGEVRMVPGVRLNADAPAALSHTENKRPPVLRIQVSVR